jgi:hypothetical protein
MLHLWNLRSICRVKASRVKANPMIGFVTDCILQPPTEFFTSPHY